MSTRKYCAADGNRSLNRPKRSGAAHEALFLSSLHVKLSDYANSTKSTGRFSKKTFGQSGRVLKNWWECDEDEDFDLNKDLSLNDAEDDIFKQPDASSTPLLRGPDACFPKEHKKKNGATKCSGADSEMAFSVYPQDLWFLIGNYIRPEDVGRFAAICRGTHFVVASAIFWKDLYKRFYSRWKKLPPQLQPEVSISRIYGLRTSVIKSLFHLYQPFNNRISSNGLQLSNDAIQRLGRRICTSFWHEQTRTASNKTLWTFFFKFELPGPNTRTFATRKHQLQCLDDMWANFEDGCCVLKAILTQFSNVPPRIIGQRLTEISVPLSTDLRSYRLRISLQSFMGKVARHSGGTDRPGPLGSVSNLLLEGVQTLKLLEWWHPEYPLAVL